LGSGENSSVLLLIDSRDGWTDQAETWWDDQIKNIAGNVLAKEFF